MGPDAKFAVVQLREQSRTESKWAQKAYHKRRDIVFRSSLLITCCCGGDRCDGYWCVVDGILS